MPRPYNTPGYRYARSRLDSVQAWSSLTKDNDQWMQLDLGAVRTVSAVVVRGRAPRHFNNLCHVIHRF